MATNTQQTSVIVSGTVPPDLNCPTDGQSICDLVAAICTVASTVSQTSGGGSSDSVAQQALNIANTALAAAQAALAAVPNRRTSGAPLAIPANDGQLSISWSPSLPDTNYEVRVTFYGPSGPATAYYGFRVVDGSRTVDGCTIFFDNVPANTKISWVAEAL